jgi:CRISPR/Cas system CSM-associated protein Csm3 (group 7 of RAMP superfamily)
MDLLERYCGRIVYTFKTLTPLFIGTGTYALGADVGFPQEEVVSPFYRVNGAPTIPGSSIKGGVRSIAEAVSPSCITAARVHPDLLPRGAQLAQSYRSSCQPTHACPACSIFGRMGQLGKASFGDAQPAEAVKMQLFRLSSLYAPRAFQKPKVYLNADGTFKGRKFYYHSRPVEDPRQPPVEVIPPGVLITGSIDFENLSVEELGLLFFATGVAGMLTLKLGGGKPLGLGSLWVADSTVVLLDADHFTVPEAQEKIYEGEDRIQFVEDAVNAAAKAKVLLKDQVMALSDLLEFTTKREAPQGMY